uniref:POU domain protein n=1 Tax=Panagrellus redivivus TaxID=6233 RepID=A0A7E4VMT2_PANRE
MMQPPQRIYPGLNAMSASGTGRYSPTNSYRRGMQQGNSIFGAVDDPFFRAQAALAEMDIRNVNVSAASMLRPQDMFSYGYHQSLVTSTGVDFDPSTIAPSSSAIIDSSVAQQATESMASLQQVMAMQHHYPPHQFSQYPPMGPPFNAAAAVASANAAVGAAVAAIPNNGMQNQVMQRYPLSAPSAEMVDVDPRELERFAEHFKQRRIKLGVTQADVGKALAHLKMPGVGSLSQSTICRFESLTLSHNNMVALKPILHSWLEKAEEAMKNKDVNGDAQGILPNTEKKRKRTSIAAPEKRLLEDYFRQQPRPTGDRISAIAEKLDLKKNVVRVWFCNQRQKQKRRFRGQNQGGPTPSATPTNSTGSNANNGAAALNAAANAAANAMQQQQARLNGNNDGSGSEDVKCQPFGDLGIEVSCIDQSVKNAAGLGLFYT